MGESAARQPDAEGTLSDTPLPHLVLYLYRRNTNGTLQLFTQQDGVFASIGFRQGRPFTARLAMPATNLLEGLIPLCGMRDADFSFYNEDLLGEAEDLLAGSIDPYALLVASLREHAQEDMVDAVLERYKGRKLRLQPGRDLERLGLEREDKALLDLIRAAPATPEELLSQSPLGQSRTRHLLYALVVTHMLNLHEERNQETFRSQVEVKDGIAVPNVGSVPSLGAPAWQRLASLRAAPIASASPKARIVSAAPNSAKPAESSAAANVAVPGAAPVPGAAASGTRAAVSTSTGEDRASRLRTAETALQRGRPDEALAIANDLLQSTPHDAELLTLRGVALFEKHRADPEIPREVLDTLKRALELDEHQTRALYTRGLLYNRTGESKKALACFKRVLKIQPKHIEAQREIRLAELRAAKP
jgi:tetratricopeptide (TPR) repeat protein